LPANIIPEPFRDFCTDLSERMGTSADFVATSSLVVTGSVVGAGVGIRPKRQDDWLVVSNLWGVVVGLPSVMMKTPTLNEVMRPLDRLAAEAIEQHEAAMKDFDTELEEFKARKDAARDMMRAAAKGKRRGDSVIDMAEAKNDFAAIVPPERPELRRYKTN